MIPLQVCPCYLLSMLLFIHGALLPCVLGYFSLQATFFSFFFLTEGVLFSSSIQILASLSWIDCLRLFEPSKWAANLTCGYTILVVELSFLLLFSPVPRQRFAWSLGVWAWAGLSVFCEYLSWGSSLLGSKPYGKSSTIGLPRLGRSWASSFISRASWGRVNLRFHFSYFGKCLQGKYNFRIRDSLHHVDFDLIIP